MSKPPEEALSRIIGTRCHGTLLIAGGTLVLYLGDLLCEISNGKPLKTSLRFWIECAWRLWGKDKILTGRYDDSEIAGRVLSGLEGSTLVDVVHEDMFHDLSMRFSNRMTLELFSDSTADTQWQLRGSDGYRYGIEENLQPCEWVCDPDE